MTLVVEACRLDGYDNNEGGWVKYLFVSVKKSKLQYHSTELALHYDFHLPPSCLAGGGEQ